MIDAGDFDELLIKQASKVRLLALDVDGVLTDGRLYFDSAGNEMKAFHTRDGLGIRSLLQNGIGVALITGRTSDIVTQRAVQLGIDHVFQGRTDKLNALNELLEATALDESELCYAGDDWLDIPVMTRVGLAITVADADGVVKERAHWVTTRSGGMGAVREICDLILLARNLDQTVFDGIMNQ